MSHNLLSIENIEKIADSYLVLQLKTPQNFTFDAGQYVTFLIESSHKTIERPYSIACAPNPNQLLEFCITMNEETPTKRFFANLKKGDSVKISNPKGTFRIADYTRPLVFVSGGSGIAPARALIQNIILIHKGNNPIHLVYGCKHSTEIPFQTELLNLFADSQKRRLWLVSEEILLMEKHALQGLVTDYIEPALLINAHYYVSGSKAMIKAVTDKLKYFHISSQSIFTEGF